jgi:transcriptional regulator with XRE-family HTH domain
MALLRQEVGHRIKVARVAAGLTQRELAVAIGLKNAADVSRYERGVQQTPDFRIDLIAEKTGRPRSYFTRDPDEPETDAIARIESEVATLRGLLQQVLDRLGPPPNRPRGPTWLEASERGH